MKKTILGLATAVAVFAGLTIANVSTAFAEEVTNGIKFDLVSNTATQKVVDLTVVSNYDDTEYDATKTSSTELRIDFPVNGVESVDITYNFEDDGLTSCSSNLEIGRVVVGYMQGGTVDLTTGPFARLTFNYAEGTTETDALDLSVVWIDFYDEDEGNLCYNPERPDWTNAEPSSFTFEAIKAEVEEPEEEPVVINAEDAGFFTYWQNATAAKAFYATLTAEQAAKDSIVWTVTDGTPDKTKTEVANIDTEVSGESGVVLGLVVSNAVEGLTATVTVK